MGVLAAFLDAGGRVKHEKGGLEADVNAGDGFVEIKAGATTVVKSNTGATAAPGATDDSAAGYAVGSVWIDTTNDRAYICVDATASAAVWRQGVIQATQAALEAETNEDTCVPPDLIKHSPGVAKAWCTISAAGLLNSPDYNIASITDTGVGDRTIVIDTDFSGGGGHLPIPTSRGLRLNTNTQSSQTVQFALRYFKATIVLLSTERLDSAPLEISNVKTLHKYVA